MNYHVSFFLLLLFSFIPNVTADGNHYPLIRSDMHYEEPSTLTLFYVPIKFSRTGIRCFLKHAFNKPEYATEFLPYNFTHVIQFLEYGNKSLQTPVYMQSIVRLFYNKIKAAHFITSYALHELLEPLPNLLEAYCRPQETMTLFAQLKSSINDILYSTFLHRFSFFKKNPNEFLDELAQEIVTQVEGNFADTHLQQEQLRQSIIKFLEIAFTKLIWAPGDGQETWKSVKICALQLARLHDANIVDENELDDLYRSLLERFCYYLTIHGSGVSLETIETIRKDISTKKLHFLVLEEQETCLESKADRLLQALILTEARAHARAQGIIT